MFKKLIHKINSVVPFNFIFFFSYGLLIGQVLSRLATNPNPFLVFVFVMSSIMAFSVFALVELHTNETFEKAKKINN